MQIALVKWGTKYGPSYVDGVVSALRSHSTEPLDIVLFTDDPTGITAQIDIRSFPEFGVPLAQMVNRGGSLPKFSIFQKGALKPGVPTLYIDLDTGIYGDVAPLAKLVEQTRAVYILSRHVIQHWRFRRLTRFFFPDRYYLGNTSVIGFMPEDWYHLYDEFVRDLALFQMSPEKLSAKTRRLYQEGNERIISHAVRDVSRVVPRKIAAKFTDEYMSPVGAIARLKNHLPWVTARRKNQAIVTFHGPVLKPENLISFTEGQKLTYKSLKTVWNYPDIAAYWHELLSSSSETSKK